MKKTVLALLLTSTLAVSACAIDTTGNKQLIGAGSGAVLGGVLGAQVGDGNGQLVATGVGTLLGLLVGSQIGSSLDKADIAYANQASSRAYTAPVGQPIAWNNPDSGNSGTITPVRDGRTADGSYCREFKQTIFVDGKSETAYGTACKNADGSWQIQK